MAAIGEEDEIRRRELVRESCKIPVICMDETTVVTALPLSGCWSH